MDNKIAFIKKIRVLYGYGLQEAKYLADFLEDYIRTSVLFIDSESRDGEIRFSGCNITKNSIVNYFNKNNLSSCDNFLHHFFSNTDVEEDEYKEPSIDLYELLYYQVKEQDLSLEKFKEFIRANFNYCAPFA
jgi:hypothetical protein